MQSAHPVDERRPHAPLAAVQAPLLCSASHRPLAGPIALPATHVALLGHHPHPAVPAQAVHPASDEQDGAADAPHALAIAGASHRHPHLHALVLRKRRHGAWRSTASSAATRASPMENGASRSDTGREGDALPTEAETESQRGSVPAN